MQQLAEDVNDPASQRAAFQFLGRCATTWLEPIAGSNGQTNGQAQSLPGFERFVYERLIPSAFSVLAMPQFNIKDGQMLVVSYIVLIATAQTPTAIFRFCMRYATSCKLCPRHAAKRRSNSSQRSSSLRRVGLQKRR